MNYEGISHCLFSIEIIQLCFQGVNKLMFSLRISYCIKRILTWIEKMDEWCNDWLSFAYSSLCIWNVDFERPDDRGWDPPMVAACIQEFSPLGAKIYFCIPHQHVLRMVFFLLFFLHPWLIKNLQRQKFTDVINPAQCLKYCQTSNVRHTFVGNEMVDHSDAVGASPAGAAPTTSSFSTLHLASVDWAKTTARRDENYLSFGIWCDYIS